MIGQLKDEDQEKVVSKLNLKTPNIISLNGSAGELFGKICK